MDVFNALLDELDVSADYFYKLSDECQIYNKHYRTFYICKGKKARKRRIDSPRVVLKEIQSNIKGILDQNFDLPDCVHGFVKNKSFITNAQLHLNKPYLLSLDIRDFFPSISSNHVLNFLANIREVNYPDAVVLSKLLTYNSHVPQGSPASPTIANLIFKPYDIAIRDFCAKNNFVYTRYADDITISSDQDNLDIALKQINNIFKKSPFLLNRSKTNFSNVHKRQEVTGLVINPNSQGFSRIKMKRRWRKNIRAGFYNAYKNPFKYRKKYNYLLGCLNILKQINVANGNENISDKKLIALGEKSIRRLRPFTLVNAIEKLLK